MYRMNVTPKGQLVIPKALRERHGILPNSSVVVTEIAGHIAVLPAIDPLRHGRGMLCLGESAGQLLHEAREVEFRKDRRPAMPLRRRKNVSKP